MKNILVIIILFTNLFSGIATASEHPEKKENFVHRSNNKNISEHRNLDSALAYCSKGITKNNSGDFTEAIIYFTKAIKFDHELATAYLNRAYAKNQLMDYSSALEDLDHALTLQLSWAEGYEAYFNRGLTEALLDQLSEAMNEYSHAIKKDSEYAIDTNFSKNITKSTFGEYRGELTEIHKIISSKPATTNDYNRRGIVKSILGDYLGAIQDFTDAIRVDNNNALAYFNRALTLSELEVEFLSALSDYSMAIKIAPDAETFNRRANIKCKLMDFHGALEDYNLAVKLEPANYLPYLNRGCLKYSLKDYASAIDDFSNSIKLKSDYYFAYYNRGLAKGKIEDQNGEIADYTKALHYKPDYDDAYHKRALAKYKIGDKQGACADLSHAVKLGNSLAYEKIYDYCK
jgi:tetratricopeptide (TPR) repeat protein